MTSLSDNELARLREATAKPSWVQLSYPQENIHVQRLIASLGGPSVESKRLAAALWNRAADGEDDVIDAEGIHQIAAVQEFRLGKGRFSKVDLLISITSGNVLRQLAIEFKVDSTPTSAQIESMSQALKVGAHRRLVLLCLGAAQACRIEPDDSVLPQGRRWNIGTIRELTDLLIAAATTPADTREWLAEIERERLREHFAWLDTAALAGCGGRGRAMLAYRLRQVADMLDQESKWVVSLQPYGPVLHCRTHLEVEYGGATVTVYLEVADGELRVKAGDWDESGVDVRKAVDALLPSIEAAFKGFPVKRKKRSGGQSVSLLAVFATDKEWTRDVFVDWLRRAHHVWAQFVENPGPAVTKSK